MSRTLERVGWSFIFVCAALTTIMVSRYLTMNPDVYFSEQRQVYLDHRFGLYAHIVGAMIAMMIGPFQFIEVLRQRHVTLHRFLGTTYLFGCAAGGLGGLYMAFFAHGGFPTGLGFGFLAITWMTCGTMALSRVRSGQFAAHREWMVRSYALTLAAFTLRVWLPIHGVLLGTGAIDVPFTDAYITVAWLSWVPNLMVAEYYINTTRRVAHALGT